MLLRRVTKHVANENWFAVCVDFVIVVVGVYVGIEVSNWNEARQEDVQAEEYLERIRDDLASDQESLVIKKEFWADVIEYGEAAVRHAETGKLYRGSLQKTVLAYFQASQVDPFAAVSTTYDEMKAAGELGLIRDGELRGRLANYYVNSNSLQAEHLFQYMPRYREYVRGSMPLAVQRYVWQECHVTIGTRQVMEDCDLPIDADTAHDLLERLGANAQIADSLRFWITNLSVSSKLIDDNMAQIEELLDSVERSLDP